MVPCMARHEYWSLVVGYASRGVGSRGCETLPLELDFQPGTTLQLRQHKRFDILFDVFMARHDTPWQFHGTSMALHGVSRTVMVLHGNAIGGSMAFSWRATVFHGMVFGGMP